MRKALEEFGLKLNKVEFSKIQYNWSPPLPPQPPPAAQLHGGKSIKLL